MEIEIIGTDGIVCDIETYPGHKYFWVRVRLWVNGTIVANAIGSKVELEHWGKEILIKVYSQDIHNFWVPVSKKKSIKITL